MRFSREPHAPGGWQCERRGLARGLRTGARSNSRRPERVRFVDSQRAMTRRCRSSTRTGRRLATQARLRSAELPNFKLSLDLAGCEQAISRAEPFALASPARNTPAPSHDRTPGRCSSTPKPSMHHARTPPRKRPITRRAVAQRIRLDRPARERTTAITPRPHRNSLAREGFGSAGQGVASS
jgi:hypothetical protein